MKFFIILTVLVAGLSVWANGVIVVPNEVPIIVEILNADYTASAKPTTPTRSIASEAATVPSMPDGDPNDRLDRGDGGGGTIASPSSRNGNISMLSSPSLTGVKVTATSANSPGSGKSTGTKTDTGNLGVGN